MLERGREEIGGNACANKTADARPTFPRQVSRTFKNAETGRERMNEKEREKEGGWEEREKEK